jgi:hypothetical protein
VDPAYNLTKFDFLVLTKAAKVRMEKHLRDRLEDEFLQRQLALNFEPIVNLDDPRDNK